MAPQSVQLFLQGTSTWPTHRQTMLHATSVAVSRINAMLQCMRRDLEIAAKLLHDYELELLTF